MIICNILSNHRVHGLSHHIQVGIKPHHFEHSLHAFEFLDQNFQVIGIVYVQSNVSLKDTVLGVNRQSTHVDVQIVADDSRYVIDQPHAVGTRNAQPRQKRQSFWDVHLALMMRLPCLDISSAALGQVTR